MLPFESLIGFNSLIDESDTFGLNTSVPELLAPLELFPRVFIGGGKILAIPGGDTVAVVGDDVEAVEEVPLPVLTGIV